MCVCQCQCNQQFGREERRVLHREVYASSHEIPSKNWHWQVHWVFKIVDKGHRTGIFPAYYKRRGYFSTRAFTICKATCDVHVTRCRCLWRFHRLYRVASAGCANIVCWNCSCFIFYSAKVLSLFCSLACSIRVRTYAGWSCPTYCVYSLLYGVHALLTGVGRESNARVWITMRHGWHVDG